MDARIERQYADDRLAALYDVFYPAAGSDDVAFYLELVMSAAAVLDVGCGTGALLRRRAGVRAYRAAVRARPRRRHAQPGAQRGRTSSGSSATSRRSGGIGSSTWSS